MIITGLITSRGCSAGFSKDASIPTPDFWTATLPVISTLQYTLTPTIATPQISQPTVEGVTTTQLNVRSDPSTIGDSLGVISPFSKIQILGRESNGVWYLIRYEGTATGNGWVTAAYVQVDETMDIPVVRIVTGPEPVISGLVIQAVNVRRGPGTNYASIGQLNPNDVVTITGRDSVSAWVQIGFKEEVGWVTYKFLKADGIDSLPVVNETGQVNLPETSTNVSEHPSGGLSNQDGDSMHSPLASMILTRADIQEFEFSGNISTPNGDTEDWIQFSSADERILITAECKGTDLALKLWDGDMMLDERVVECGTASGLTTPRGKDFLLQIQNAPGDDPRYSSYILKVESIGP